jgi:hypothetical protein
MGRKYAIVVAVVMGTSCVVDLIAANDPFESDPINYSTTQQLDDPVARFNARLTAGKAKLNYDSRFGYLPSVLKQLGIPQASQVLVFSKTSLQNRLISPSTPRAIYFNDHSYIGFVRGGRVIEVASVDPKLGTNFYTLDQGKVDRPKFIRATGECLGCHATSRTRRVPGLLVRSVYPDRQGHPILRGGSFNTTYTSPIEKRWGGWYVSGKHIDLPHMGNQLVADRRAEQVDLTLPIGSPGSGKTLFDPADFLQPTSDVVALMVLEHQVAMQNVLIEARHQTLYALRDQEILDRISPEPGGGLTESIRRRIDRAADRVVRAILFVDEAAIERPIAGHGDFRKVFEARPPATDDKNTLRKLELAGRLFKLPMSYLVYSESFDALPKIVMGQVYRKLHEVLTSPKIAGDFWHVDMRERIEILRILRQTKKGLPDYYRSAK